MTGEPPADHNQLPQSDQTVTLAELSDSVSRCRGRCRRRTLTSDVDAALWPPVLGNLVVGPLPHFTSPQE